MSCLELEASEFHLLKDYGADFPLIFFLLKVITTTTTAKLIQPTHALYFQGSNESKKERPKEVPAVA